MIAGDRNDSNDLDNSDKSLIQIHACAACGRSEFQKNHLTGTILPRCKKLVTSPGMKGSLGRTSFMDKPSPS